MQTYTIDRDSVDLADLANRLRILSNAADGYHAQQHGGTYGPASEALTTALACGLAEHNSIHFDEARELAKVIAYQCVDNGEPVIYQIEKVFAPDSGYLDEEGAIWFAVVMVEPEVIVDRVTGRPATVYTPPEDRLARSTWLADFDAAIEEAYGGWGGRPTAGEGCGS